MSPRDDLPAAIPAMWRALKRGYQAEPRLLTVAFGLSLLSALPDALMALWLMLLADGVTGHHRTELFAAAIGLGVSAVGTWFLRVTSDRIQRRFRDRLTIALESHVARLQATVATIAHHERPEYLDRLAVLRDQVFVLDHMYMSLFSTCGWILRLGVTVALLMSINPALALLAAFALPTVLTSTWRPGIERAAEEQGASANRLARHLFTIATTAPPGKEVRVTRIGNRLVKLRREAWERWYGPVASARWGSAGWHTIAWLIFGAGYIGAVVFVTVNLRATPGQVLLVLAAGSRLSAYIGATVGEIGFLRGIWLDGSKRLAWLEDYAASLEEHADTPAPERLVDGIRFEHVSFAYPGTTRHVLEDVNLNLKPGSVVAIVGENGAGKSTLVKLLARLYQPDHGRILVDGIDLARIPALDWRAHVAGAFQDFFKFEFRARHSVGVGDVPRLYDQAAVLTAVERAGADDVIARLAAGLETQLGPTWPDGVEVSFGQWQKLALARGFMRDHPLLLILDEPTAALDAETEHALFERYAAAARGGGHNGGIGNGRDGRITILISHRFSTVRMADQIVVLDGARVAEVGTHEALMAKGGQYAELYGIQAAAYR
ncbi:MAG: ABC transporter ATP-binding protein [Candidatus Binatus sp.]|uniref:ABC transporter ATP-binding protein n=1 Tax=Candidatus Binatus sp. TaxID=2811406 RepID=UPI00271969CE|nr:ABC transporter ATP-binding protein [Candidatus Binatus sp.]MDO8432610.1 ABC transporter ATP-binding protein [Candidatus Binatus sp.]